MNHWTEKYIGKRYSESDYDCADMIREVTRDFVGLEINLPEDREWRRRNPEDLSAMCSVFAEPTDEPKDGCGVIMKLMGNRRSLGTHVGAYADVNGRPWVLHNMERIGVVLTPILELNEIHLELFGYYKWI